MGKSAPSPPAAPDPAKTSAAQTASNKETALYNFGLSNPNMNTPLGNINYNVTGGEGAQPTATGNVTLSPETQRLYEEYNRNILQQSETAGRALGSANEMFYTPYDLKGNVAQTPSQEDLMGNLKNTQDALYSQQTQYLDPQFQKQQDQLNSGLANQGLAMGSKAYENAQGDLAQQKQQAYQSARESAIGGAAQQQAQLSNTALANQAQQAQLYTQQYQAPLSFYNSLITGTQPNMPQFGAPQGSNMAGTNVQGAYQDQYKGQLNQYNAEMGAQNSATSGLFSLGSAALPLLFSDRRLKKNIKRVGRLKNDLPLYEFSYIWEDKLRVGVMADDVEKAIPEAVVMSPEGYKMVNYSMLGD